MSGLLCMQAGKPGSLQTRRWSAGEAAMSGATRTASCPESSVKNIGHGRET